MHLHQDAFRIREKEEQKNEERKGKRKCKEKRKKRESFVRKLLQQATQILPK